MSALSTDGITEVLYELILNCRAKSNISIIKPSPLKLFMGITALHSEDHTKQINTLWGKNVQVLNVKVSGTVTTVFRSVRGRRLLYHIGQMTAALWYDYHNIYKIPLNGKNQPNFIMQTCE
jgi:hypothetical protein